VSSRFDFIRYDDEAETIQARAKNLFQQVEKLIFQIGDDCPRAKSLAMTKLEEAYMWVGKAIRDQQITRLNVELLEGRTNS